MTFDPVSTVPTTGGHSTHGLTKQIVRTARHPGISTVKSDTDGHVDAAEVGFSITGIHSQGSSADRLTYRLGDADDITITHARHHDGDLGADETIRRQ